MLINHCPSCWRVNADEALNCAVCGADLGRADTVRLPLEPHQRRSTDGALWLHDLVGPTVGRPPRKGVDAEPVSLTLRDVEAPAEPASPAPASPVELVQSDPEVQPPLLEAAPEQPTILPTLDSAAQLATLRAERRAEVRRGRRGGEPATPEGKAMASEVLVVGAADASRTALCDMLQAFGFTVHATDQSADALARASSPSLLASFVSADFSTASGGNGIDLCGQLRHADGRKSGNAPLLVLVAAKLRPMDRVRAELAGCDDAIPTPITRGSVARLLDTRGIALPTDPRRVSAGRLP